MVDVNVTRTALSHTPAPVHLSIKSSGKAKFDREVRRSCDNFPVKDLDTTDDLSFSEIKWNAKNMQRRKALVNCDQEKAGHQIVLKPVLRFIHCRQQDTPERGAFEARKLHSAELNLHCFLC